jgi:small-conductance mechanosensitive channel
MDINSISDILETIIPLTEVTIGNILTAIIIIVIGYIATKIVVRYIRKAMKKANLAPLLVEFTSRVTKILLLFLVIIVALGALRLDVGAYIISLSVVLGFVVGFAFQDMLGNLAAGFMIALTKPFKKGDYVDVAGKSGTITSVGISITTLLKVDNTKVTIPNSKVWGEPIENYTAMKTRMIDLNIGIGYGDDISKAIKIVFDVLRDHKNVLKDPEPMVATSELADSSVNLVIRPWVKTGDYWPVKRELTQTIKETFDKEGISIPFPQRDIHFFDHSKK